MLNKKIIISFLTICLLSSSIYAKQSDNERENKKRDHKHNNYNYDKDKDYNDKSTFISTLKKDTAQAMIADGNINGGMIPKVEACIYALEKGAGKTSIIDGRQAHSLILELFTSQGIGTQVIR